MYTIAVMQGNPGNNSGVAWYFGYGRNSDLVGPVQYGIDPRTGTKADGAQDLVIGPYTVELARLNAEGSALELSRTGFSYAGEELFGDRCRQCGVPAVKVRRHENLGFRSAPAQP